MNKRAVFNTVGKLLLLEAALMVPPLLMSLITRDGIWYAYLITIGILLAVSPPLVLLLKKDGKTMYVREGMATAGISWILIPLFATVPLIVPGFTGFCDAFFELCSGFTTTGASIFPDATILPDSIQLLRCSTHWVGGMGVLVLSTAVLPGAASVGTQIARAESPGPGFSKLVPRLGDNSKVLYFIYALLTVLLYIALRFTGIGRFDALLHALSTAGTGGFSNQAASISSFMNPAAEIVITVFMFLFGVNFCVYFRMLIGDFKGAFKNEELYWFVGIAALMILVITFNILPIYGSFGTALRYSSFQLGSVMSTTGFYSADFETWPTLSKVIMYTAMIMGSCVGSTAGGLKLIRLILLVKLFKRELVKSYMPRRVQVIKLDGKTMAEDMLSRVMVFFFVYIAIWVFGAIVLACNKNVTMLEAITGSLALVSNDGPGLGQFGPTENFAAVTGFSKILLSLQMLAARLEFYPLLMLFCPGAWRKN